MQTIYSDVERTQPVYRSLLQAISMPAKLTTLPLGEIWEEGLYAITETLFDHEVSFCVISDNPEKITNRIFSITKAKLAGPESADYIIINKTTDMELFENIKKGTPAYPDNSATIIYLLPENIEYPCRVVFEGPGIDGRITVENSLLPEEEWLQIKSANSEFPLGIDIIIITKDNHVLCIPRSTKISFK